LLDYYTIWFIIKYNERFDEVWVMQQLTELEMKSLNQAVHDFELLVQKATFDEMKVNLQNKTGWYSTYPEKKFIFLRLYFVKQLERAIAEAEEPSKTALNNIFAQIKNENPQESLPQIEAFIRQATVQDIEICKACFIFFKSVDLRINDLTWLQQQGVPLALRKKGITREQLVDLVPVISAKIEALESLPLAEKQAAASTPLLEPVVQTVEIQKVASQPSQAGAVFPEEMFMLDRSAKQELLEKIH
jgi:hypothetical protein